MSTMHVKCYRAMLELYLIWITAIDLIISTDQDASSSILMADDNNNARSNNNQTTARMDITNQWKVYPRNQDLTARRDKNNVNKPSSPRGSHRTHYNNNYAHQRSSKTKKPNIILILTDDQDVELGSLNFMRETSRILQAGGAEFRHAYTTTPMCCPSRSSLLTGLYVHNHNVYTNSDNCSSPHWQTAHETRSFATYLSEAGYHTGYFGKYLNKYNGSYTPPGWDEWGGLIMNSKYYNYSINMNGQRIRHGNDYHKDYYPDVVANHSLDFLRQWKQSRPNKPALLVASFPAPHGPEDSAPQYSDMFFNITTHHTPSYDYAPNSDKQWILRVTGPMLPIHKEFTNLLMTKRLQTLQSVDYAVKRIYEELRLLKELENSYIIYTSDHGYHLGQFGLIKGKAFPFESDIRVPFLVRGPGVEPGTIVEEVALNIDLAPTFLDIAGLQTPSHMDGRSLLKLFHKQKKTNRKFISTWPDTFLIESSGRREVLPEQANIFFTLDTQDTSNFGRRNLNYNVNDTLTMKELSMKTSTPATNSIPELLNSFMQTVNEENMENGLSLDPSVLNKAGRMALECQRPKFGTPCRHGQKWHCVFEDNRWRKHKCKFYSNPEALPYLRKCTCITDDGIVYTRFQTSEEKDPYDGTRRISTKRKADDYHPTITHYLRSNKSSEELVDELAKTWRIMKRHRRHTGEEESLLNEHVLSVINVINGQMMEFQTYNNGTNNSTCIISYDGSINCAHEIYDDPKLWDTSQKNVFTQIQKLQMQLAKLKDIHRHLKKKRPSSFKSSQNNIRSNADVSSSESLDTENSEEEEVDIMDSSNSNHTNTSHSINQENSTKSMITNGSDTNFTRIETEITTHRHRHQHNALFKPEHSVIRNNDNRAFLLPQYSEDIKANVTAYLKKNISRKENRLNDNSVSSNSLPDTCYCVPHDSEENDFDEKILLNEQKQRAKEHREKKRKRKLKRKEKECHVDKMNCFRHDNDHWRTAPFWTGGPFCFCMNANNNTYTCLRTVNSTHNFLYCEFITGFVTFYNLRIDPFQQWNRYSLLPYNEKSWLKNTLAEMVRCKGNRQCGKEFKIPHSFSHATNVKRKFNTDRSNKKKQNVTKHRQMSAKNK